MKNTAFVITMAQSLAQSTAVITQMVSLYVYSQRHSLSNTGIECLDTRKKLSCSVCSFSPEVMSDKNISVYLLTPSYNCFSM